MQRLNQRTAPTSRTILFVGALFLASGCGSGDGPPFEATAELSTQPTLPPEPAAETQLEIPPLDNTRPATRPPDCAEPSIHCGATPSPLFDGQGRLWAAFEQDGKVYVTASDDLGATFRQPVAVHTEPERIETNGENRPKIAIAADGPIYVSWTKKVEGRFKGDIRFSRSFDSGLSFEPPRTINDDGQLIGHRFDSLHVDPAGHVYLAWIDKRDLEASRSRSEAFRGASIYSTVSTDQGATFAPNRQVAEHACECCRIAIADGPGDAASSGAASSGAAILWRHIFEPNIRDHAFAILTADGVGPMSRPSDDNWTIDACPHHGPAMVPAGGSSYHLTWFTAAAKRPVVYYGRFDAAIVELQHQVEIAADVPAAHPHILESHGRLFLVWKTHDRDSTQIALKVSNDAGSSWTEGSIVATTDGGSDHPFLLGRGDEVFLSWHTAQEGWRLSLLG